MIQVAVCSSTPAMRAGLRALLLGDPGLVVAAVVSQLSVIDTLDVEVQVVVATPDALDARAAEDGEEGGFDLHLRHQTALLLVSDDGTDARQLRAFGLPAWGVISPEASGEALQIAVRALNEGLVVLPPEMAAEVLHDMETGEPAAGAGRDIDPLDPLTGREIDVLRLMARGLTNKQIALSLGISEHTVKFHVSSMYSKLGVSNRAEAVRKGARRGLVPL